MDNVRTPSKRICSRNQSLRLKIIEQFAELSIASLFAHVIFGEKMRLQLIDGAWNLELLPHTGRDRIETEAITLLGIERDQLVVDVGLKQLDCAALGGLGHCNPIQLLGAEIKLAAL